jgi:hypothetical protein
VDLSDWPWLEAVREGLRAVDKQRGLLAVIESVGDIAPGIPSAFTPELATLGRSPDFAVRRMAAGLARRQNTDKVEVPRIPCELPSTYRLAVRWGHIVARAADDVPEPGQPLRDSKDPEVVVKPFEVELECIAKSAGLPPAGLADIDHFAQFIRGTLVPPRDTVLAATPSAVAGQVLFNSVGCVTCHVSSLTTVAPGTVLNGGTFTVPAALGSKIFHPYGDFLLHDVGTGDGIVQAGPADTANKLRTTPLWGLHIKSRFMHDNASLTVDDAIQRHGGEAGGVTSNFNSLTSAQQQQLINFLKSL